MLFVFVIIFTGQLKIGERGEPGVKGMQGNTGAIGSKGQDGLPGSDGPKGLPGDDAQGPPGRAGPQGSLAE